MRRYVCTCIKGHKRTFRLFPHWRRRRFYERTHLHPEVG